MSPPLFDQRKFLALNSKQQHKWAAKQLRLAYDNPVALPPYRLIEKWLHLPLVGTTHEELSERYHFHLHAAMIHLKEDKFLPDVRHLDRISGEPFLPIDIYLDNLRSAHNVGSIIRTTEALRLGSIHFSEKTPYIDHPKIEASAMGTHLLVPTFQRTPLNSLKRPLIALETAPHAHSLHHYTFPPTFTLMVGNEEYGLSKQALDAADLILEIPLYGSKNSLNVAVAFAITASTIRAQLASPTP